MVLVCLWCLEEQPKHLQDGCKVYQHSIKHMSRIELYIIEIGHIYRTYLCRVSVKQCDNATFLELFPLSPNHARVFPLATHRNICVMYVLLLHIREVKIVKFHSEVCERIKYLSDLKYDCFAGIECAQQPHYISMRKQSLLLCSNS